jgi:DNA mismatch endonuclease (patch repair protein)
MDTLSKQERSERMSRVRHKDTKPELIVRSLVHHMGFRYKLHDRSLPGNPDLVFPRRQKIIFVHGCFWHRHGRCACTRWPKSRLGFWRPKLEKNQSRDRVTRRRLAKLGWKVLVVWECQLRHLEKLASRVQQFLER